MLAAFVIGLLLSNFAIVVISSVGFVSSQSRERVYVAFGGMGDYRHVWRFDGTRWTARSGAAGAGSAKLLDVEHNALIVDRAHPAEHLRGHLAAGLSPSQKSLVAAAGGRPRHAGLGAGSPHWGGAGPCPPLVQPWRS